MGREGSEILEDKLPEYIYKRPSKWGEYENLSRVFIINARVLFLCAREGKENPSRALTN